MQADRLRDRPTTEDKIGFLIRPFIWEYASEEIIASTINYLYFKRNMTMGNFYSNSAFASASQPLDSGLSIGNMKNIKTRAGYQNSEQMQLMNRATSDVLIDVSYC